jgi:hypothetical protein
MSDAIDRSPSRSSTGLDVMASPVRGAGPDIGVPELDVAARDRAWAQRPADIDPSTGVGLEPLAVKVGGPDVGRVIVGHVGTPVRIVQSPAEEHARAVGPAATTSDAFNRPDA